MANEILKGYRVLDMTMWQLGPVNTMMLATMGAEVIKLEAPRGDDGRWVMLGGVVHGGQGKGSGGWDLGAYFETNNRLKKGLVLDLTRPRAREILYELVAKSDVFEQNMRFGVAKKLGCDYETLKKYNPKLIYCTGTSYGTKGPDATKPGMDLSGAARSGWMWNTGTEDGNPVWALPGSSDQIGAIFGAFAIVAALLARERYGIGQEIETSHLTGSMWLMGDAIQELYYAKRDLPAAVPRSKSTMPLFSFYKCGDGEWITMVNPTSRHWQPLCEALGIPASTWRDDPRFKTEQARWENRVEVVKLLDNSFAKKSREEWIKEFEGKDIFWERLQKFSDLEKDPQVIANDYFTDYTHPTTGETYKYQNLPMQFRGTPALRQGRAPLLGEHTAEILVNILGYKKEEVPKLIEEIGAPQIPPKPAR